ncbi:MAG: hypothetical protein GF331_06930 [Chitinivibrionales bacterium]|nr:hypothetical protein [Chitinivibrionales bacterium]
MDENLSHDEKIRRLRKRLEQLNRSFVKEQPASFSADDVRKRLRERRRPPSGPPVVHEAPKPVVYRRGLPRSEAVSPRPAQSPAVPVTLEDAVDGELVGAPGGGACLLVSTRVDEVERRQQLSRRFRELFEDQHSPLRQRLHRTCGNPPGSLSELLFMDIETTGLSNVPLFLIGIMTWENGAFHVHQFLARSYAEEAAVVALFVERASRCRVVVTFNGKSFDIPFIRTRAAATGVRFAAPAHHVDLLHEARRVWRGTLPDCKLQTLESIVCGHGPRYGDIPGAEIGDAYHAFVRSGNAWQIVEILKHNMLDLVTLAEILTHLPPLERPVKGT